MLHISKVFSPLTFSFLLDKTFYQCLACKVAVRCNDCGVEKISRRCDKKKMTSKQVREKGKCYHDDRTTFTMCDDMKYFDVNWRKRNNTKENLQPNCLECNKLLLWMPKKKEN